MAQRVCSSSEEEALHFIMDNTTIHKTELMKRIAAKSGLVFVFTSPTSLHESDEEVFRFLKASSINLQTINEYYNQITSGYKSYKQDEKIGKKTDGFLR